MQEASLTRDVAFRSRTIALSHSDSADRFLAATASVHDLVLVTGDARILAGGGFQTLPNQ
jgi:PIN domain nuclease of toxin-antitoxin system